MVSLRAIGAASVGEALVEGDTSSGFPSLSARASGPTETGLAVHVVTSGGIRSLTSAVDLGDLADSHRFYWVDVVGQDEQAFAPWFDAVGLDAAETTWLLRFGQTGRMAIDHKRLRAVTWLTDGEGRGMSEVHLLSTRNFILTVWDGEADALSEVRTQFRDRISKLEKQPHEAAAILLQLLLATLHRALSEVDGRLQDLQMRFRTSFGSIDVRLVETQLQRLQAAWSDIDRYSSAVRTAIIGIEALPGMAKRGAAELNDYAEQVEDLEHRMQQRSVWATSLLQDYATTLARHETDQISRLTVVSLIFLPLTFLTGFFGMNFDWMIKVLGSRDAFLALGVLTPVLCAGATVVWLRRRGLV